MRITAEFLPTDSSLFTGGEQNSNGYRAEVKPSLRQTSVHKHIQSAATVKPVFGTASSKALDGAPKRKCHAFGASLSNSRWWKAAETN